MNKDEDRPPDSGLPDEFTRFQRLARALFRVDKREIPKHVPEKRIDKASLRDTIATEND